MTSLRQGLRPGKPPRNREDHARSQYSKEPVSATRLSSSQATGSNAGVWRRRRDVILAVVCSIQSERSILRRYLIKTPFAAPIVLLSHGRCCSAEAEIAASTTNGDKREPASGYRSPPQPGACAAVHKGSVSRPPMDDPAALEVVDVAGRCGTELMQAQEMRRVL